MIKRNKKLSLELPSYEFPLTSTSISTAITPHRFTFQVSLSVSTITQTINLLKYIEQNNLAQETQNQLKKVREALESELGKKKCNRKRVNLQAVSPIYVVDSTFQLIRKNNSQCQDLEHVKRQLITLRENYRILVDKLKRFQSTNTETSIRQHQQHITLQARRFKQYQQLNKQQEAVIIKLSQQNVSLKNRIAGLNQQLQDKIRLLNLFSTQERDKMTNIQICQDDLLTLITLQAKQLQRI